VVEEKNGDPVELLANYQKHLSQIQALCQSLKDELEAALG
jgi:hypothetical protein